MSSDPTRAVRTVFCATDFSPTAELALAHAEAIAKRHGAKLFLGHVVEPWPAPMYPPVSVPDDTERILRAAATQRLDALVAARAGTGLVVLGRHPNGVITPGRGDWTATVTVAGWVRSMPSTARVAGRNGL